MTHVRPFRTRQGITLMEVLCASVAAIAVLGGLGGLYLMALTAHGTGTLVAESLIYEGRAEERLRTVQLIATRDNATGARFRVLQGPIVGASSGLTPDGRPQWISIAYDCNINHRDPRPGVGIGANAIFPRQDQAVTTRQSGVVFWYRAPLDQESNLYHVQCPRATRNFIAMDAGAMGGFITPLLNRTSCELLAQNVVDFIVTASPAQPLPGFVTGDLRWTLRYRARDF